MRRFARSASSFVTVLSGERARSLLKVFGVVTVSGIVVALRPAHLTLAQPNNVAQYGEFKKELALFLSSQQIECDLEERTQRGKPWNSYHKSGYFPEVILYPESTEQVSKIVKTCNKYKIPLVPFGGGTSLEGQTLVLPSGGVSLDFNRMKRVIELNEDDLDVRVEAGLGYVELNEILKGKGIWFPLDPGPGASIGGTSTRL